MALLAVQILAIDLMGEMFSLAALAWDPPVQDMLKNKPRNIHEHILNSSRIKDLIISGLIM
ncbi:MAG: cation transporting ATPase C-terminal domain-containing protein [bacterium]|nr:cation transporting ATPase C-terminal domain-containing protein [bacterium]